MFTKIKLTLLHVFLLKDYLTMVFFINTSKVQNMLNQLVHKVKDIDKKLILQILVKLLLHKTQEPMVLLHMCQKEILNNLLFPLQMHLDTAQIKHLYYIIKTSKIVVYIE